MRWEIRGLIEGFYGRPWSWDDRIDVARWCAARAMTHYVYAPKDDPLHRSRWREPYGVEALDGFARLIAQGGLSVGFAVSPGLSMDYDDVDDRRALAAKIDPLLALGVDLVCLALDDLDPRPGLGTAHAGLTRWLHGHLDGRADLVLVPTEYTGTGTVTPYLEALAAIPDDVPIAWTGVAVVNDTITVDEARRRADALGGRLPLLWDNYPVNDAFMVDRLFLGPLRGRDPGLAAHCSGYLANPMSQPMASKLPLASAAAYLRGEDPDKAWAEEAGDLRVLAEACDGVEPRRLVAAAVAGGSTDELRAWLLAAEGCAATGLGDEAAPWVEQAHAEARVGLQAMRVIDALGEGDLAAAHGHALGVVFAWPGVRRSAVTVMGARCSIRPVMTQDRDGGWVLQPGARSEDENAIDHLVRFALDRLTGA